MLATRVALLYTFNFLYKFNRRYARVWNIKYIIDLKFYILFPGLQYILIIYYIFKIFIFYHHIKIIIFFGKKIAHNNLKFFLHTFAEKSDKSKVERDSAFVCNRSTELAIFVGIATTHRRNLFQGFLANTKQLPVFVPSLYPCTCLFFAPTEGQQLQKTVR